MMVEAAIGVMQLQATGGRGLKVFSPKAVILACQLF